MNACSVFVADPDAKAVTGSRRPRRSHSFARRRRACRLRVRLLRRDTRLRRPGTASRVRLYQGVRRERRVHCGASAQGVRRGRRPQYYGRFVPRILEANDRIDYPGRSEFRLFRFRLNVRAAPGSTKGAGERVVVSFFCACAYCSSFPSLLRMYLVVAGRNAPRRGASSSAWRGRRGA